MADQDYNRRNKVPRPLSETEKARLDEFIDNIHYSARWVGYSADFGLRKILTSHIDTAITNMSTDMSNFLRICWKLSQKTIMIHKRARWSCCGRKSGALSGLHRCVAILLNKSVCRTNYDTESWMGALWSPWARTAHTALQVSPDPPLTTWNTNQENRRPINYIPPGQ